jgi:integrase
MPRRRIPGSIDRHGDRFRIRLCIAGERHNFTIPTTDRRAAEAFAKQRVLQLTADAERRAAGMVTGKRVSELIATFERDELPTLTAGTSSAYRDSLKPIKTYFLDTIGDPSVESVRAKDILAFIAWRRGNRIDGTAPLSNRTLQKDRAVLHRLFAIADQLEWRDGNPVARTEPPPADRRDPIILDDPQFEALLTQCADRPMLQLYVLALAETGMRCESEALRLTWADVDLEKGDVRVVSGRDGHRTKTGKSRYVPMTSRLLAAMRDHFARYRFASYGGQPTPWVFHHDHTALRYAAGERIGSLHSGFRAAANRAKLPAGLHQHDLRHRRVTTWLAEGRPATLVKEAMGHADLRMTMGYTHLTRDHLRALVVDMPREQQREAVAR